MSYKNSTTKAVALLLIFATLLCMCAQISPVHAASTNILYIEKSETITVTVEESDDTDLINDVPLFNQGDYPNTPYGNYGTVASHGCGITCVAMVATYLTDKYHAPDELADRFGNYNTARGSYWSLFGASASKLGLGKVEQTYSWSKVKQALANGQPVVSIQSRGRFTNGGHFILLTGLTEDGRITVNDPNGNNWTKNQEMIDGYANGFEDHQITDNGSAYWIYQKKG